MAATVDQLAESLSSFAHFEPGSRPTPRRVSLLVAMGLMLNYVLGVGVLELPFAFSRAGVLLSLVSFVIASSFVAVTLLWVVETSARARAFANVYLTVRIAHMVDMEDSSAQQRLAPFMKRIGNAKFVSFAHSRPGDLKPNSLAKETREFMTPVKLQQLLAKQDGNVQHMLNSPHSHEDDIIRKSLQFDLDFNRDMTDALEFKYKSLNHGENKGFELNELLAMFAPAWTSVVYEICLVFLLYFGLMSFSAVFANSMVAKFPITTWGTACDAETNWTSGCESSFLIWAFAYCAIVSFLSCLEIMEMLWFQMVLSVARFLLVACIVLVSVVGLFTDPVDNKFPAGSDYPYISPSFELWDMDGFITVVSAAIFSTLITFGVPELIAPLKSQRDSSKLVVVGCFVITLFYALVGTCTTLYFGKDLIQAQINLTFANFSGGVRNGRAPWWASIIQFFVGIFPALDVISMFPLICISLANTVHARLIRFESLSVFGGRAIKIFTRLASAIPPALIPLVVRRLDIIIKYTVVPGVFVGFIAPSLLQYYSIRACKAGGASHITPYTVRGLDSNIAIVVMIIVGFAAWAAVIYQLTQ